MKIVLDDISCKEDLYPFSSTRSVADIRIGILTIREKWEKFLQQKIETTSEIGLNNLPADAVICPANILPTKKYITDLLAGKNSESIILQYPWHLFQQNDKALREDFSLISEGRSSQPISSTNKLISPENIFIEEGAVMEHCIVNASEGPVYIGKNALVMEGSMLRGPISIGEGSTVKMGTKIYAATTIGPYCIAGGEIKNTIMFGYSNKAHDGYLGDAVIGEWCNLGAGTSNSNLKNTAGMVNVWINAENKYLPAGKKCGLIMGDYSRCAINTSFNTGTVAGICCNIFAPSFPAKYIADFTWGNEEYLLEKALTDIDNWKKLKNNSITEKEIKILSDIYFSQKLKHA